MHIYTAYLCDKKKKKLVYFQSYYCKKNEIETISNVLLWDMSNICSRLVAAREKKLYTGSLALNKISKI